MEAVKAELLKLQQQRSAIEAEINERSARLNGPGQPGMQESLIDKEVRCCLNRLLHPFHQKPQQSIQARQTSAAQRMCVHSSSDGILSLVLQGFPRADIDVHGVRIDRNAVIRLTNDHKAISKQLEELLHKLHALARCVGCAAGT
jgi:hypothetical protein